MNKIEPLEQLLALNEGMVTHVNTLLSIEKLYSDFDRGILDTSISPTVTKRPYSGNLLYNNEPIIIANKLFLDMLESQGVLTINELYKYFEKYESILVKNFRRSGQHD